MIDIKGIKYMTEKEAANRYGYSSSWFRKRRMKKETPRFVRLQGKGKIYYPIDDTDKWFQENLQSFE